MKTQRQQMGRNTQTYDMKTDWELHLTYQLTRREAYDTFYLLASRQGKKTKNLLGICLTAIAGCLLILYAMDSRRVHYLFLAVIAIFLLFYLLYNPVIRARKGAANVTKMNGTYKMILRKSGQIQLPGEPTLQFGEDKFARAVETDTIFALRPDAQHTLCIPKRILTDSEIAQIREMIENNARK